MPELNDTLPKTEKELLAVLAKLGGQQLTEDGIVHEGSRIVLPLTMSKKDAVKALIESVEAEEKETQFSQTFNYRPWDGALAFQRVVKKYFGLMTQVEQKGFMGMKIPPAMITIRTGPDMTEQVPWGDVHLAAFPGATITLSTGFAPEFGMVFTLYFTGPKKFRAHAQGLFNLVRDELACCSIYRGKAFDGAEEPNFLDLSKVNRDHVVYSEEILTQLDASIWSLIRYSKESREHGLPLKRAVLLEGEYGTGKTLAAFLTAQEAVANGWTFIYCRPKEDNIELVMQTARMYQPAVVFFEDMDEIAGPDGADSASELLDTFDGITAKGVEVVVILTTNHKERIHKGMLRPGRLDAVIHIGALDEQGVEKMIRANVPLSLIGEVNVSEVYAAMEGFMPAFVKEAIDRAKRYSLARNHGKVTTLNTSDFVNAALGLRPQLDLMNNNEAHNKVDRLGATVQKLVTGVVRETVQERLLNPVEA